MTVPEISVHDLAALGASARVIDVRELHEWDAGHIAHAQLVPLATVPDRLDALDGDRIYLMCRSGGSQRPGVRVRLIDQGLDVVNVAGGMLAWVAAGFDTVSGGSGSTDAVARG